MLSLPTSFALSATAFSFIMLSLAVYSTLKHHRIGRRRKLPDDLAYPGLSLLKPLKGLEEKLDENLRSFYAQDYPGPLEIVFSAETKDDPALAVARRIASEFPEVPTRFVLSDPDFGLNPKVSNLEAALRAASHDLVLQSDANTRAPAHYLRRIVSELLEEEASLLSSVVVGRGERNLFAAFENLHLTALIGPSTCTALHVGGVSCVIGKSMLFRKSELERFGGLGAVRNILCEDFILGRTYQENGRKVVLSTTAIENINLEIDAERFLARHSRWLKMRAVIHVGSFILDLFANPIAWSLLAVFFSGFAPLTLGILALSIALKLSLDALLLRVARGEGMSLRFLLLAPMKDLLIFGTWFYAAFSRTVVWRGRKLRFGKDSELREDDGVLPIRLARRLLTEERRA